MTTEVGCIFAFNIAKAKKPYTEEKFIKKNMKQVISILESENKKLQKLINEMLVARHTIERRVSFISADILNNLQKNLSKCLVVSELVLNEN